MAVLNRCRKSRPYRCPVGIGIKRPRTQKDWNSTCIRKQWLIVGLQIFTLHTGIKFFSLLEIKGTGLEVNVDKTKCMVMSGDQNAG